MIHPFPDFGQSGEPVRDLQRRLAALGFGSSTDEPGRFGEATASAVQAFQLARGLTVTAGCDQRTWNALIEAGYRFGDRLLYLKAPMLRGDDVGELQRRLGALGFDPGRVDGIFGPDTAHALEDYQRNAGLVVDGICGPECVRSLERLRSTSDRGRPPAELREEDALRRAPRTLEGRRVVVGQFAAPGALGRQVAQQLARHGAIVLPLDDPDESVQARMANAFGAHVYLGLLCGPSATGVAFYAVPGFVSAGGLRLAQFLHPKLTTALGRCDPPLGMRIPILRETKMAAVLCTLAPIADVQRHAAELARGIAGAVDEWVSDPVANEG
ncbi:MAG: peptidoglycan-binding protein [Acidimicrobiia bacterium]